MATQPRLGSLSYVTSAEEKDKGKLFQGYCEIDGFAGVFVQFRPRQHKLGMQFPVPESGEGSKSAPRTEVLDVEQVDATNFVLRDAHMPLTLFFYRDIDGTRGGDNFSVMDGIAPKFHRPESNLV